MFNYSVTYRDFLFTLIFLNILSIFATICPDLRKLSFCMSRKVSDISIILGFKFPEIREINLSWCLNITDGGLYHLVKNNPSLERIVLMKVRI